MRHQKRRLKRDPNVTLNGIGKLHDPGRESIAIRPRGRMDYESIAHEAAGCANSQIMSPLPGQNIPLKFSKIFVSLFGPCARLLGRHVSMETGPNTLEFFLYYVEILEMFRVFSFRKLS